MALGGDWNIAPQDDDVWSMEYYLDKSHVSPGERAAFNAFLEAGFVDVVRPHTPGPGVYTYWDYQRLAFPKRRGMRIDFVLGSPSFAARVAGAAIDREERKGAGASDHAPVVVQLDGLTGCRPAPPRAGHLPRCPAPGRRRSAPGAARRGHRRARAWSGRRRAAAAGTPAEGVTVVLAHGWTLTHASWLPVVELLRSRYGVRVVAFDQPGHGLSAAESRTPTVHELGEVLHRVLTAVAPTGPLVLAGHSMGGMTIMAWAADHADELAARVRGVVFVATSAKVGEDRVRLPLERAVDAGLGPRSPGRARSAAVDPFPDPAALRARDGAGDGRAGCHAHPEHLAADAGAVLPRPAAARRDGGAGPPRCRADPGARRHGRPADPGEATRGR